MDSLKGFSKISSFPRSGVSRQAAQRQLAKRESIFLIYWAPAFAGATKYEFFRFPQAKGLRSTTMLESSNSRLL